MKKIWIFGDSFSTGREKNTITWTNLLAKRLDATLEITAKGGSSLAWMMYKSSSIKDYFGEDDFIIFQTTTLGRALLNKDRPGLAEYWKDCPDWNSLNKKEQEGYQFHMNYIHDEEVLIKQFEMWMWGMSYFTKHLKHKPIIVYAWDIGNFNIPPQWLQSQGFLLNLSMAEFAGTYDQSINWMLDNAGDPRHNHFSTTNHYLIEDILYEGLINRVSPDFNKLKTGIYSRYPKVGNESWDRDWIL
jgi:hypothetical protein